MALEDKQTNRQDDRINLNNLSHREMLILVYQKMESVEKQISELESIKTRVTKIETKLTVVASALGVGFALTGLIISVLELIPK